MYEKNGMVTGRDVVGRALLLMGYTNAYGEIDVQNDAEIWKRGQNAVQQIFDDLQRLEHPGEFIRSPLTMDEPIPLGYIAVQDIMPYGVAMFLAQSEGDGDTQVMFAQIYNRKRAGIPCRGSRRVDVLPR